MKAGPIFCLAYPMVYDAERRKHENRGRPGIFLGLDNHASYIVRDLHSKVIYYSSDAIFYPQTFPFRTQITVQPRGRVTGAVEEMHAAPITAPGDMTVGIYKSSLLEKILQVLLQLKEQQKILL